MRVYLNIDAIILIMYHRRLSRADVAKEAGITSEYLSHILRNGHCGGKTAAGIARALGLQLDQAVLPQTLQIPESYKPRYAPKRYRLRDSMVRLQEDAIYALMRMRRITFDGLAARFGCTRQNVHQKLADGKCSKLFAHRLADALGVSYETITKEDNTQ